MIGERVNRFEAAYRAAIEKALSLKKQTIVCTIYNGNLAPEEASLARIALMTFNDVIMLLSSTFVVGLLLMPLVRRPRSQMAR